MKLKVLIGILWALAAVVAGLALYFRQQQQPSPGLRVWGADLETAREAATEAEGESTGKKVPNFSLSTLEPFRAEWGETLDYREFAGTEPLVINFWASWCVPCREEAPRLEAAWQKYGDRVQFLGINYQDQEADALAFIEEFGHGFPSGADPRGEVGLDFGLFGLPATYFVDPEGTIRSVKIGEISADELESNIQGLLTANAQ